MIFFFMRTKSLIQCWQQTQSNNNQWGRGAKPGCRFTQPVAGRDGRPVLLGTPAHLDKSEIEVSRKKLHEPKGAGLLLASGFERRGGGTLSRIGAAKFGSALSVGSWATSAALKEGEPLPATGRV